MYKNTKKQYLQVQLFWYFYMLKILKFLKKVIKAFENYLIISVFSKKNDNFIEDVIANLNTFWGYNISP